MRPVHHLAGEADRAGIRVGCEGGDHVARPGELFLVGRECLVDRVELRGDSIFVYRDVYGLATRSAARELMELLSADGIDTTRIDTTRVRALIRNVPRRGAAAPISALEARIDRAPPR